MEEEKKQCHFISNTHWDREWRFSARRTQYMLGYMLDMLLDILDKNPDYRHYHLDSQTMPIQDYLEVYPEKKEKLRKYIKEGRIAVGPWFCLPDEFCVGGESLIRNLLLGHKIAGEMGGVSKTGYSPFGWGQISQLPQIYSGFDIHFASFYRGLNGYMAPKSEFYWESPDGTRIYASRLGRKPRYNIWYVVQRPAYFNMQKEMARQMPWNDNNGLFKWVDEEKYAMDYQYVHPFYGYFEENIPKRARQAMEEQDGDWSTPHRFWSDGHDSSCPDAREARMIKDLDEALPDADVFHSTLRELEQGIIDCFPSDAPVLTGEMRYPFTKGSVSAMFGWILSARMNIKQENFRTERDLTSFAEPLAVFASFAGAPYPRNFIDLSYNYMLQNHGHDSIGACGRDVVYEDVVSRFRQSRELSSCVFERAFMDVAGDIDLRAFQPDEAAVVIYNPAPFSRSEVMELRLELPKAWGASQFAITDPQGKPVPFQLLGMNGDNCQIIQNPNDVPNVLLSRQAHVLLDVRDVPGFGYRTLRLAPAYNLRGTTPMTLRTGPRSMENEHLRVRIEDNGTFAVLHKASGKTFSSLGYLKDSGETGNPWYHIPPEQDEIFTTLGERAEVTLIRDGALETAFRTAMDWSLPQCRAQDEKNRSAHRVICRVESVISLKKGSRYVEVVTTVHNNAEDHYLQVAFPTGIDAKDTWAQGQFDVVKRPVAKPDYSLYDEIPMTEHPMNSFVDLSDGGMGAALLNTGLKAYEAEDDGSRTLYLTLLRAFPLRICVTDEMQDYSQQEKGSQCLGVHTFRYAFLPHEGDWEQGEVWKESERFNLLLSAGQLAPTAHGKNPLTHSFIEFDKEGLHVSAVKQSEDKSGYVVRLFNPSQRVFTGKIRLNHGIAPIVQTQSPLERQTAEFELPPYSGKPWSGVERVSLEEIPQESLAMDEEGFVPVEVTGKKIVTLKFFA